MNLKKYPQYHLKLLTFQMLNLKDQLIPEGCDDWCINATIINRAYYSAFLYCELWLEDNKGFRVKNYWDFNDDEEIMGEHKQVREALKDFGESSTKTNLTDLFELRVKADYDPFVPITDKEVADAIHYMEKIFSNLQFE